MRTCRQPTIKSLFFLTAVVAALSACFSMYLRQLPPPFSGNDVKLLAPVFTSLLAFWLAPISISLFVERYFVLVVIGLALMIIGVGCSLVNPYLPFLSKAYLFDSPVRLSVGSPSVIDYIAMGVVTPMTCLRDRFLHGDGGSWLLIPYGLIYISLGPAFAWTCRLRTDQKP